MRLLDTRETTCCFTGHRSHKLPWGTDEDNPRCIEFKDKLRATIQSVYGAGMRHFICGMAEGSDLIFCEEVISLREYRPEVTIEAAIPCETQSKNWPEQTRNRYFRLVSQCDIETLVQAAYTPNCMIKRNIYMVDNSSVLIAVFAGSLGGTMQTINYAKRKELKIIEIKP